MKKLALLSLLIFSANILIAQGDSNSNWVDSILNNVSLDHIEIFDEDFNLLENSTIELESKDTVINCQWTRPKFIDNIFQNSFDGVLVKDQIIFDTSTNEINTDFVNFIFPISDPDGNYLKDSIVFIIKRKSKSQIQKLDLELFNDLKNTEWVNHKIEFGKTNIELDSCHKIFKLRFKEDFTFHQSYGNNQSSCRTQLMEEEKEVGVESEDIIIYKDKLQGHYINISQGTWQVDKNELKLMDVKRKRILSFEIEKINREELHLKLKGSNYKLKMKNANQ